MAEDEHDAATPEATTSAATTAALPDEFRWMGAATERGIRAVPDKHGLRLSALNIGGYADVPDYWPHDTLTPRGAAPPAMTFSNTGYSLKTKADVWSENAADLYEEQIQRGWKPATDVPWETLKPLPEDMERAMCQVCTEFSEVSYVLCQQIGKWDREVGYGYHEIKCVLANHCYDFAKHAEALRKRALANGGGLGLESPGFFLRSLAGTRKWLDFLLGGYMVFGSYLLSMYSGLEAAATSEAEKKLFGFLMQDMARTVSYGAGQLKFRLENAPASRMEVMFHLFRNELVFARELRRDSPFHEAMAILLGGGLANLKSGYERLDVLRRRFVNDYVERLAAAGLPDWRDRVNEDLGTARHLDGDPMLRNMGRLLGSLSR